MTLQILAAKQRAILVAVSLLLCSSLQAQNTRIYVGTAAPRGSFKDYASPGWNAGVKTDFQVKPHLCLVASLDMFYNSLAPYANDVTTSLVGATSVSTPICINIPLMVHAKFSTSQSENRKTADDDFDFWCEGAIGLNRRTISQCSYTQNYYEGTDAYETYTSTLSFDAKTTFAHQWGVGVTYRNRISVALVWYNLGRSKLSGTCTSTQQSTGITQTSSLEGNPMRSKLRTFRIGYTF